MKAKPNPNENLIFMGMQSTIFLIMKPGQLKVK
jgi:hypothetical protein